MLSEREKQIIGKCESWGADKVRAKLTTGTLTGANARIAQAWLDGEDRRAATSATIAQDELARFQAAAARDAADASSAQARAAEESNRLALAANDLASEANRKAQNANIIATLAAIAAVIAIGVTILDAFLD